MAAGGGGSPLSVRDDYAFLHSAVESPEFKEVFTFFRRIQVIEKGILSDEDSLIITIVAEIFDGIKSEAFFENPSLAFHNSVDDYVSLEERGDFIDQFEDRLHRIFDAGKHVLEITHTFTPIAQKFSAMIIRQLEKGETGLSGDDSAELYSDKGKLRESLLQTRSVFDVELIEAAYELGKLFQSEKIDALLDILPCEEDEKPEEILLEDLTSTIDEASRLNLVLDICEKITKTPMPGFGTFFEEVFGEKLPPIPIFERVLFTEPRGTLAEVAFCLRFHEERRSMKNAVRRKLLENLPTGTEMKDAIRMSPFSDIRLAYYTILDAEKTREKPPHLLDDFSNPDIVKELDTEPRDKRLIFFYNRGIYPACASVSISDLQYSRDIGNGIRNAVLGAALESMVNDLPKIIGKYPLIISDDLLKMGAAQIRSSVPSPPNPDIYRSYYIRLLRSHLWTGKYHDTIVYPRYTSHLTSEGNLRPLYELNHATLMYIDLKSKTVSYFDSSGDLQEDGEIAARAFIAALEIHKDSAPVHKDIRGMLHEGEWKILTPSTSYMYGVPRQTRSKHCALFAFMYAHDMLHNRPFEFHETDLDARREHLIAYTYTQLKD